MLRPSFSHAAPNFQDIACGVWSGGTQRRDLSYYQSEDMKENLSRNRAITVTFYKKTENSYFINLNKEIENRNWGRRRCLTINVTTVDSNQIGGNDNI